MRYYAIADIHGRADLLKMAHEKILNYHSTDEPYHIITLGDYIDRGPDSKGVISYLYDQRNSATFISLQGNHEAIMVETIRTPLQPSWWIGNGGNTTLLSYGSQVRVPKYYGFPTIGYDPHVVPIEHVNWIADLPLYYETEKQVFVHAGLPLSNAFSAASLDEQAKHKDIHGSYSMQWMLYGKDDPGGHGDKHVVHGHHQFEDGPHEWSGRTDLDCYAWKTGRLVIGVYDDTQGKALEYLEVNV